MRDRLPLADHLIAALARRGVRRIFGIPGGGSSLALIRAAGAVGIDFVLTRTETAAALMAAVTGELTGTPGVVLTGVGPGAASAVNGVAYAYLERAPLLLLTDGPAASLHQAFDQNALFRPVTKAQGRLEPKTGPSQLEAFLDQAMTPPWGPVQLDLTAADAESPVSAAGTTAAPAPAACDQRLIDEARALLAGSRKPVLLAGLEARHGDNPTGLQRLVEALGCPLYLTYKAKGVVPDGHESLVGSLTGARGESDGLARADLIIAYGLDPVELIPAPWSHQAPVLDLRQARDPVPPGQVALCLVAPLADTAERLLPLDCVGDWTKADIGELRDALRARLALKGEGATVESVVSALARQAPAGCRLTVDSGAHMFSAMAHWPAREPFGVLKSNGLSTMGFALPAAIASALQEPERPVAAVTGDGGLMMCLAELATAVEQGCRLVVVVVNDAALSLIDVKQQRQQHRPSGVRYPQIDFAAAARALGCSTWSVGPGDELAPAIEQALAAAGPTLIDVAVEPSGYAEQLERLRG